MFLSSLITTYQSFFFPCDITMSTTNFVKFEIFFTKFLIPALASSTVTFSLRLNSKLNLWVSMKVFSIFLISESVPLRFDSGSLYEDIEVFITIIIQLYFNKIPRKIRGNNKSNFYVLNNPWPE